MGAAKSGLRAAQQAAVSPADRGGGRRPDSSRPADEEEILAEVSHDLGNHLHRLYYCADHLRSAAGEQKERTSELLERSVRSLDELLKALMGYLRPVRLEPMRMSGAELASAVSSVLRTAAADGTAEVARGPDVDAAEVNIDPARFASALSSILRQLLAADANGAARGTMHARFRRLRASQVEFLEMALEAATAETVSARCHKLGALDWAAAERILEAHGGRLDRRAGPEGLTGCTITLPLANGRA